MRLTNVIASPFRWVDAWMVKRVFKPLVQSYEQRTGHTQFRLAFHSLSVMLVAWILATFPPVAPDMPDGWDVFWLGFGGLVYGGIAWRIDLHDRLTKRYRDTLAGCIAEEFRLSGILWKWIAIVGLLTDLVWVACEPGLRPVTYIVVNAGLVCMAYFVSMPIPPKKPKKQEAPKWVPGMTLARARH